MSIYCICLCTITCMCLCTNPTYRAAASIAITLCGQTCRCRTFGGCQLCYSSSYALIQMNLYCVSSHLLCSRSRDKNVCFRSPQIGSDGKTIILTGGARHTANVESAPSRPLHPATRRMCTEAKHPIIPPPGSAPTTLYLTVHRVFVSLIRLHNATKKRLFPYFLYRLCLNPKHKDGAGTGAQKLWHPRRSLLLTA